MYKIYKNELEFDLVYINRRFNHLMREDVHVRRSKFPSYGVNFIRVTAPTCGKTYMYVEDNVRFFRFRTYIAIQNGENEDFPKILYRILVSNVFDVHVRLPAYGRRSMKILPALSG